MIDNIQIQKLTDLPIESVASRLGLAVSRHKSLCPFHEDSHPSLTFDARHNRYRCFVCGEYGRTIDLVMKMQHLSFPDACKWLADGTNVIIEEHKHLEHPEPSEPLKPFDASRYLRFFERPWLSDAACRFLYEERLLDPRVIRWCRITSWRDKNGINWLQTPYYDVNGQLIGIQNRNLDYRKGADQSRFRFPKGSRCNIYNLQILKMLKPGEELWITEGCSDCWAMLSAGHKAIAIPSATLLKQQDVKILETCNLKLGTAFHMYPDQDVPGERLFLQLRDLLTPHLSAKHKPGAGGVGETLIRHQLPIGCKDFSEYYIQQKVKGKEVNSIEPHKP